MAIRTDFDDRGVVASAVTTQGSGLQNGLQAILGAHASQPVIGALTRGELASAALVLLMTAAAHLTIAAMAARQSRKAPGLPGAVRPHLLHAARRPLSALIWIVGGYFAILGLIPALGPLALQGLQQTLRSLLDLCVFAVLIWLCYRLTTVVDHRLEHWAASSDNKVDDLLLPLIGQSLRILLPVLGTMFALPLLHIGERYVQILDKAVGILLIGALALIAFRAARALESVLLLRFDIGAADNLKARSVYTQVRVIGRVIDVIISLFAAASILMLFTEVRHVGTSLLASAGILGIVAGVAAQKTLANLMAGFQIALAQPIRQDDVLVVEGEWGRVEEITLTYVVIHIWDDRRLVVPLGYFIEKPFQNWTRTSAQLLGSVSVWVDYSLPVEEFRSEVRKLVETNKLWDGRYWNLQVTDADAKTMQLRVLATSADSSASWDLRCALREHLIALLQRRYPHALPRHRVELSGESPVEAARGAMTTA